MCKQIAKYMMKECPICTSNDLVEGKYPENGYSAHLGWDDGELPEPKKQDMAHSAKEKMLGKRIRESSRISPSVKIGKAIGCKSCGYVALFAPELSTYDERKANMLRAISEVEQKRKRIELNKKQETKLRKIADIDDQIAELARKRSQIDEE